ncbi:MAG: hypothetical protein IMZ53_11370 [Thermoplasmata archaeon]|nr:hypothetical protein [Thermoplasmata archaeon]
MENEQVNVVPEAVQPESVSQPATDVSVIPPATGTTEQGVPVTAPVQPEVKTEQAIPYTRFQEVNEAKKTLEQQNQILMQQLRIQQEQPNQQEIQVEKEKPLFIRVCEELGYKDETYLTQEQNANVLDRVQQIQSQQMQQQTMVQGYVSSKNDYANVVGKTDPMTGVFQIAEPLKRQTEKNPLLAQALVYLVKTKSPYTGIIAYEIASKDTEYQKSLQKTTETVAAQQVAQALSTAQRSISAVSGTGTLDKVAQIRGMTDAQFAEHLEEIKRRPD